MENTNRETVLKIEDLKKSFLTGEVLKGVNLEIPAGKIVGLLGNNGSGKTTLLKILAGMTRDYEGKVSICGSRPGCTTKNYVAYLSDKCALPDKLSISEIIDIYERFFDDFDRQKCLELLDRFEVNPLQRPGEISLGTAEKAQIALTMARKAKLYILDEPLGAIDVVARDVVIDAILDSFGEESSMIIVTHLISEIEKLFDDACVLKDGKITLYKNCDELRAEFGGTLQDAVKDILREEAV